jgi:hypothetical protein
MGIRCCPVLTASYTWFHFVDVSGLILLLCYRGAGRPVWLVCLKNLFIGEHLLSRVYYTVVIMATEQLPHALSACCVTCSGVVCEQAP